MPSLAICLLMCKFITKFVIILGIRKDFSGNRVNILKCEISILIQGKTQQMAEPAIS